MNEFGWIERVLNSDAGRGARERAEELVREAGGELPKGEGWPPGVEEEDD